MKSVDLVSSTNILTCFVTCNQLLNLSELHVPALQNVNALKKKNSVPLLITNCFREEVYVFQPIKFLANKCSL